MTSTTKKRDEPALGFPGVLRTGLCDRKASGPSVLMTHRFPRLPDFVLCGDAEIAVIDGKF